MYQPLVFHFGKSRASKPGFCLRRTLRAAADGWRNCLKRCLACWYGSQRIAMESMDENSL